MNPARPLFDLVFGLLALAGLLASLAVHLLALLHIGSPPRMGSFWFLHAGIFVLFVPMVLLMRKDAGGGKAGWAQWRAMFPGWVFALLVATWVYAVVNFFLFMQATQGGNPALLQDGRYVLSEHGRVIREITRSEFDWFEANEVRGFSGHWIAFYAMSAAYYLLRVRR